MDVDTTALIKAASMYNGKINTLSHLARSSVDAGKMHLVRFQSSHIVEDKSSIVAATGKMKRGTASESVCHLEILPTCSGV